MNSDLGVYFIFDDGQCYIYIKKKKNHAGPACIVRGGTIFGTFYSVQIEFSI